MGGEYHGLSRTKVWYAWSDMRKRCQNKTHKNYDGYGGRGILVCSRWDRFINFFDDMGHPPTKKHTLDRINNNGNYEPKNCKWSTWSEQNLNKRISFHCRKGHPWKDETTILIPRYGKLSKYRNRVCRICYEARTKTRKIKP